MGDITVLLEGDGSGKPHEASELLALVYDELKKIAANQMAREQPNHTLQATALVHEAWLRLVVKPLEKQGLEPKFTSRKTFFQAAAVAMRRILVDRARQKRAQKRGGGKRASLLSEELVGSEVDDSLVDLDEALQRFAAEHPIKAKVVELRYFGGLTMPQIGETLGLSLATVERHWNFSRAWLFSELNR